MKTKTFLLFKGISRRPCSLFANNFIPVCHRHNHFDIAITGGGLVGTAMACAVAKNPKLSEKKVILFESSPKHYTPKKTINDDYSNRVVSLNPGTRKFLESLGAWEHIRDVRYKAVKKLQVWDACSDTLITFNDELIDDVSYIVENDLLLFALEQVCSAFSSNITIKYEAKVKSIEKPLKNKPVALKMENGDVFTCNLLVGADGVKSKTRDILGCQYLSWDYHQKGVVATLKLSEPMENVVAWQRFLPTGPIALLPLSDELSSLVWSTGMDHAEHLLKLSEEEFIDAVNNAFWKVYPRNDLVSSVTRSVNGILEKLTMRSNAPTQLPPLVSQVLPKSRAAFPLGFGHSTRYIAPGIALIGDAAHRVHPLAGQGVNLGFGDVELLTNKLAESVYSGAKLGASKVLADYESQRQKEIIPMLAVIDMLQKLYTTSFPPVVLLRSVGLQITNALSPVKKKIIEGASG